MRQVVAPWEAVLALFDGLGAAVQHAGVAPAAGGFEWFNFFWVTQQALRAKLPCFSLLPGVYDAYSTFELRAVATASFV